MCPTDYADDENVSFIAAQKILRQAKKKSCIKKAGVKY
jgi:hypothetical protein